MPIHFVLLCLSKVQLRDCLRRCSVPLTTGVAHQQLCRNDIASLFVRQSRDAS
jgi:hypothetical protein